MPRNADFEKVYQGMVEKYGEEKAKVVYYAWLNSFDPKLDDTKPMPKQLPKKKESYVMPLNVDALKDFPGRVYLVKALHVGTTGDLGMIDEEGLSRFRHYDEDELKRAARTLTNTPVNLNHARRMPGASVVWGEYNDSDQSIDAVAVSTNEELNRLYDEGKIVGASVEFGAVEFPQVDGVKPTGIIFSGLAFVSDEFTPGDPKSHVILIKEILAPSSEKVSELHTEEKEVKPLSEKTQEKTTKVEGTPQASEIKPEKKEQIIEPPLTPEEVADKFKRLSDYIDRAHERIYEMGTAVADLKGRIERIEQILMAKKEKVESVEKSEAEQTPPTPPTPPTITPVATVAPTTITNPTQPSPTPSQPAPATSAVPQQQPPEATGGESTGKKADTIVPSVPSVKGVGIVDAQAASMVPLKSRSARIIEQIPRAEQIPPKMGRSAVVRLLESIKKTIEKELKE